MVRNSASWSQVAGAILVVLGLCLATGCREYPPVSTEESQDMIKLVYTAANTRDEARLAACEIRLKQLIEEKKMGEKESAAFQKIIDQAKKGDWQAAQDDALQFARDQVR
ncbi:MAG: hypothetical protein U0894_14405 [Pirellulales bacterium]